MRRLLAGLVGIAVMAVVLATFGAYMTGNDGVSAEDPGPEAQGEATTAQLSEPTVDGVVDAPSACDADSPGTANPAAVYCYELGYEYQIVDTDEGQRGVCLFSDGSRCDAWRFLEGKCGQSYSYCATQGYDIITKTDGRNPFSREYSVCVLGQEEIGPVTELMGLAEMADSGPIPVDESPSPAEEGPPAVGQPSSFDWRNHSGQNWMTSVKDQNPCGGCWAFSAVGITEAVYNIGWNDPDLDHDLSEQQLISNNSPCCGSCGDCDGGLSDVALAYITDPGIADEACFPFTATTAPCALCPDWTSRVVTIADTGSVPTSPATIKQYLIDKGPLSVYVQILEPGDYWDGDIYKCEQPVQPNHAVVLVGYNDAGGYWIAKNSWGTGFESAGYYKVGYGECFIEDYVYYAVPQPKLGDYRLTMQVSLPGSGSTDPPVGDHWYDSGTTVDVCASPNPDWRFDGWSGDCSGLSLCTSVYMDSHKTCTANFCPEGCTCHPSSDVPKPIDDYTTTLSVINVGDSFTVTDVNAGPLFITHTWDNDLEVFLNSPNGTRVELFTDVGGSGDNFTNTTLDDECATPITSGSAPFTGCYQPEGLLSDFDGQNSAGVWTLEIYDAYWGDSGTLDDWSLVLCGDGGEEADVKIVGQSFVDPPAEIAVSVTELAYVETVLHNNGPIGPVEVTVGYTATAPADCDIYQVGGPQQVVLPVSVPAVVFEDFEIHCSEPSSHTFSVESWVSEPKDPHVVDPIPGNNSGSAELTVAAIAQADVKVTGVVVDGPDEIAVSVTEWAYVETVLHNNGPEGPVEVTVGYTATAPADCDIYQMGGPQQVVLPVSVPVLVFGDFEIHCSEPSSHTFSVESWVSEPKDPHVGDPDLGNNSGSAELTVAAIGSADVKIVNQHFVDPPTEIVVSVDTPVTLRKVLHNNGPYSTVTMTINKTATADAGSTITPPSHSEQVELPVSMDVTVDEQFIIHCFEPDSHTFTVDNTVSGPKEPHVVDPNMGNNTAQSTLTVLCSDDGADVKVLDFWTDPAEVDADVSEWIVVNAGELKHNNGPSSATATAYWVIDNPPEVNVRWLAQPGDECTLDGSSLDCDDPGDINDLHFEVFLPVSDTVPVDRQFELHCKTEGIFVLTLTNNEWPINMVDPDPTNNYLETELTVHCHPPTDTVVRIESGYVAPGGTETVTLEVLNVPDPGVCMILVDVIYDPGVKTATSCDPDPGGRFENALCNLVSDRVALTLSRTADGLTGDFPLADITFHADPDAPMGSSTPLDVDVRTFADCEGTDIPVTDVDGDNTIGMLGDVDCDRDMDGVDALFCLQYLVYIKESRDYCPAPSPPPPEFIYGPAADVDRDTDVDGVDCLFMLQCLVYIPNVLCPEG